MKRKFEKLGLFSIYVYGLALIQPLFDVFSLALHDHGWACTEIGPFSTTINHNHFLSKYTISIQQNTALWVKFGEVSQVRTYHLAISYPVTG